LSERHDSRKEALDRLLEMLESGRAALRADQDLLRQDVDEHQDRLKRIAAEQDSALAARGAHIREQLQAASLSAEAAFQQRVAASLDSFRAAFAASLGQMSEQQRQRLSEAIRDESQKALERIAARGAAAAAEQTQAIDRMAAALALRLEEAGREAERHAGGALQAVDRRASDAAAALEEAAAAAAQDLDDRWRRAAAAAAETAAAAQQTRAAIARESAEVESQTRQRQQFLETQLAGLFSELQEKRAGLENIFARLARTGAELGQWTAGVDRQMQQSSAALQALQRDMQAALEKRAAALGDQLRQALEQSQRSCEQELAAIGDAAQGVFDARARAAAEQLSAAVRKNMEQTAAEMTARLERSLDALGAEQETRLRELAAEGQRLLGEERRKLEQRPEEALHSLDEQIQQISRLAVERVREAHEMLLRDLPSIRTEAELVFRQGLDRIIGQVRDEAESILRALVERVSSEGELEVRRRLHAALQSQV